MVRQQVAAYAEAGFAMVFITAAAAVSEPDWQAMRGIAALLVHRRNAGRDFGAWKDVLDKALSFVPDAQELLLTNDSVLGPILPLDPLWPVLRAAGAGMVGLTESLGGGAHLQSYFLLFRGRAAIADAAAFLRRLRLSSSKWLIVQRGELGLTRAMLARGHRVMAVFGYERIATAIADDKAERLALIGADARLASLISLPDHLQSAAVISALKDRPLNLTHHLWAQLVRRFGFPFVKTDLISRNPHRLAGTENWPELVGQDSPCPPGVIAEHLRRQAAKI
jgi:lipopolysaccharide biosynthesis protein